MKIDVSMILGIAIVYYGLIAPFWRFTRDWKPKTPHTLRAIIIAFFIPLLGFAQNKTVITNFHAFELVHQIETDERGDLVFSTDTYLKHIFTEKDKIVTIMVVDYDKNETKVYSMKMKGVDTVFAFRIEKDRNLHYKFLIEAGEEQGVGYFLNVKKGVNPQICDVHTTFGYSK